MFVERYRKTRLLAPLVHRVAKHSQYQLSEANNLTAFFFSRIQTEKKTEIYCHTLVLLAVRYKTFSFHGKMEVTDNRTSTSNGALSSYTQDVRLWIQVPRGVIERAQK